MTLREKKKSNRAVELKAQVGPSSPEVCAPHWVMTKSRGA